MANLLSVTVDLSKEWQKVSDLIKEVDSSFTDFDDSKTYQLEAFGTTLSFLLESENMPAKTERPRKTLDNSGIKQISYKKNDNSALYAKTEMGACLSIVELDK